MNRFPVLAAALLAAAIGLLAVPAVASAEVRAEVRVIHATGGAGAKPQIDPALKPIAGYLTKSFGARYAVFSQLDLKSLTIDLKQRGTVELPNETTLALTFKGVTDGFVRLFMELPHLKTTVKIRDGGLFFQAGQSYKGGMLILAIRIHLR